mgnify:CR=1 FL=1
MIGLVALLTISDLPWRQLCSSFDKSCCHSESTSTSVDDWKNNRNYRYSSAALQSSSTSIETSTSNQVQSPHRMTYHTTSPQWNAEHASQQTPVHYQYKEQSLSPTNVAFDNVSRHSLVVDMKAKRTQEDKETIHTHVVHENSLVYLDDET